ncbi:MAG TPA: hypothetical protein VN461_01535 [Vicinamibacteria bacterium]|jgi:hypothetical protein|nr:hypothetical protein [Vicinamibacteria bacterium]
MPATLPKRLAMVLLLGGALAGCSRFRHPAEEEPLPVKKVEEEIIVAAWAEPPRLPAGGGSAQLLVRVQKRGGAAYPGVEVRFRASTGTLYSGGNILVTDRQGETRDRVTTPRTVTITLNAGGTRYRFKVPVGEASSP